jgi:hypothetical protein
MRLTVGFTEGSPQHELPGRAGELITVRYLAKALDIAATRYLIMRTEFLDAIDADPDLRPGPALAGFIDVIRGGEDEQMVLLTWWPVQQESWQSSKRRCQPQLKR